MSSVGLRELRQNASELVRRVEAGEEIDITVAGRPAARLVPVEQRAWQSWDDVADVFRDAADTEWDAVRAVVDGELSDPWTVLR